MPESVGRLLAGAVRRAPGWAALGLVGSVAGAVLTIALPAALSTAVDDVLRHRPAAVAIGWLIGLLITKLGTDAAAGLSQTVSSTRGTAWLQGRLVSHVLSLGVSGTHELAPGDLASRVVGDTSHAAGIVPGLVDIVVELGTSATAVVALWLIDWRLGLTFLLGLPVVVFVLRGFAGDNTDLYVRYQRLLGAIAGRLTDALAGGRTIEAFGTYQRETARVVGPLPELSATGYAIWRVQRKVVWRLTLLAPVLQIAVLAVGGFGVAAGRLSIGLFLAAGVYVQLGIGALNSVDSVLELSYAVAAARRLTEILVLRPTAGVSGSAPVPDGRGAVAFRSVTVRRDGRAVLDRVDLDVPAGAAVAVVGRSAAGKSMLTALVGRLTEPDEGAVLLDGVPVTTIHPAELRRAVGYAFDRPALLGDTIADAIGYGPEPPDRARIVAAARIAAADGFIDRLPNGYDTALADAPLSGGERQRIGLARAVATDRRVLVLDDATSSLDTVTEAQVSAALTAAAGDRTRLIVAHRAGTAARADTVVWLDDGRIRATAPHAALWADPGYRAVFATESTTAPTTAPTEES